MASKRKKRIYPSDDEEPMPDDVLLIRTTKFARYYQDVRTNDVWLEMLKKPDYCCEVKPIHDI